jgi:hypothetical protein
MSHSRLKALAAALALLPLAAAASDAALDTDIRELREQLKQLRENYEKRIEALENRLAQAEAAGKTAAKTLEAPASASRASPHPSGEGAFNPAVSLILGGSYTRLSRDPGGYRITGFAPSGGEVAPAPRSWSLGESELSIAANIDPLFRGQFAVAVPPEGGRAEVEEAFIQTPGLGQGFTLKAGRFLSSIGYLNDQHAHAWDFADAPLAYKSFFANQLKNDGLQVKWLAPTETYIELGAEASRGGAFPSTDRNKNGNTLGTLFAHAGGDAGLSHSWRAGLSLVGTSPRERGFSDTDSLGGATSSSFSGRSRTAIADFTWKWAPNGDASQTSFKLQGEYFRRNENGTLASNSVAGLCAGGCAGGYDTRQSGGYLQGAYQFAPRWRIGLRHDRLNYGTVGIGLVNGGVLAAADLPLLARHNPQRNTAMIDWSPSEFSRLRLQFARDDSRLGQPDNQLWLQYIVSLGAHGAHKY